MFSIESHSNGNDRREHHRGSRGPTITISRSISSPGLESDPLYCLNGWSPGHPFGMVQVSKASMPGSFRSEDGEAPRVSLRAADDRPSGGSAGFRESRDSPSQPSSTRDQNSREDVRTPDRPGVPDETDSPRRAVPPSSGRVRAPPAASHGRATGGPDAPVLRVDIRRAACAGRDGAGLVAAGGPARRLNGLARRSQSAPDRAGLRLRRHHISGGHGADRHRPDHRHHRRLL